MKFGIAKHCHNHFTKIPKKSLNAKKNNKELSLIEDRKAKQIFVTKEENSFFTLQIHCRRYRGPRGPCPQFWFTKNTFFQALRYKKIDNDAKRSNI